MNRQFFGRAAFASSSGLLFPFCFAPYDQGWLAWIVLIPLHLALRSCTGKQAFWIGWLTGLLMYVGTIAWVVTAMHTYGKMPLVLGYAVMLLLAGYLGLYVAVYALVSAAWQGAFPILFALGAPCLWVGLELARTYLFSGFPWVLFGYSQYRWLPIIQIADHTGVYGISFLLVLVNVAGALAASWLFRRYVQRASAPVPWPALASALALFVLAFSYGSVHVLPKADPPARALDVALIQPNIDQGQKWNVKRRLEILKQYTTLTKRAPSDTDLIVWPEAATPFLFEDETAYRAYVQDLVRSQETPLLFGSPALRYYPDGRPYLLNSAYLLAPDGEIAARYDKRHLVPFGEYIPLRSILFFLNKLVVGIGDFKAGTVPTVLELPRSGADAGDPVHLGVTICFEVIFPSLTRELVLNGADLMVTITNDAWFGRSAAPYQHFSMTVLRAVENRVAYARAANTGVSGFIAPDGRIQSATPIFTEQTVAGQVSSSASGTFYTRYGDLFAYLCAIIAGIFVLAAVWQGPVRFAAFHRLSKHHKLSS